MSNLLKNSSPLRSCVSMLDKIATAVTALSDAQHECQVAIEHVDEEELKAELVEIKAQIVSALAALPAR